MPQVKDKFGKIYVDRGIYGCGGNGLWHDCPLVAPPHLYYEIKDHFTFFDATATVGSWVTAGAGTEVVATTDGANGILSVATGASDNDEAYVATLKKVVSFSATKKWWSEIRFKITDDALNEFVFGVADAITDDLILDDDGGFDADFDGVIMGKLKNTTTINMVVSNSTAQSTATHVGTAAANTLWVDDTFVRWGIKYAPINTTYGQAAFYVNGKIVKQLRVTLASMGDCKFGFGIKSDTTAAQTALIDYVRFVQEI